MNNRFFVLIFLSLGASLGLYAEEQKSQPNSQPKNRSETYNLIYQEVKKEFEKEEKKMVEKLFKMVIGFLRRELPKMVKDIVVGGFSSGAKSLGRWIWPSKKEKQQDFKDEINLDVNDYVEKYIEKVQPDQDPFEGV